jgi:hypothetical protein
MILSMVFLFSAKGAGFFFLSGLLSSQTRKKNQKGIIEPHKGQGGRYAVEFEK